MCAVNPIMYQNQIDKLPQIQQDYEEVKDAVDKENKLPSIFDIIPTFRRVERVPDKVEHSDFVPATGLVALAVLNAPEDWRDMKSAYAQIKASALGEKFTPSYDYKTAQNYYSICNIIENLPKKFHVNNITQTLFRILLFKPFVLNNSNHEDIVQSIKEIKCVRE